MSKKVYIFLADGFEDIEGLTVVDLMRRVRPKRQYLDAATRIAASLGALQQHVNGQDERRKRQ